MKQKKPTRNEIKTVLSNVLVEMSQLSQGLRALDAALGSYIDMKGDTKKWDKYLKNSVKKAKEKNAKQKQSKGK